MEKRCNNVTKSCLREPKQKGRYLVAGQVQIHINEMKQGVMVTNSLRQGDYPYVNLGKSL
jgi:hypothetical protein